MQEKHMRLVRKVWSVPIALGLVFSFLPIHVLSGQSVASGTIEGTVVDPTGGVVVGANVMMRNPITGASQTAVTDAMGMFRFTNVPFNPYHIEVTQTGFASASQDVNVRTALPIPLKITLNLAN